MWYFVLPKLQEENFCANFQYISYNGCILAVWNLLNQTQFLFSFVHKVTIQGISNW